MNETVRCCTFFPLTVVVRLIFVCIVVVCSVSLPCSVLLCECNHNFFIHNTVDVYLVIFQRCTMTNSAAMNLKIFLCVW